jgi:hypothetical protein
MGNRPWIVPWLLATLCACTPPDEARDRPEESPADLFSEASVPAPERAETATRPSVPGQAGKPSIDLNPGPREPDYQALKAALMPKYEAEFKGPEPGMKVVLVLRDGMKKQGVFLETKDDKVFIELEAGILGYARTSLHPMSQTLYFASTFAQYKTLQDLKARKAAYDQAVVDAEIARAQAGTKSRRGTSTVTPTIPRNDPGKQGAVWQVVQYLRTESRDPTNMRFLKWGKVQPKPSGEGWQVSLQYAYSTPEQSNYVTHKWFLIDKNGQVYRTALYKE